jgi:hypothetical protein
MEPCAVFAMGTPPAAACAPDNDQICGRRASAAAAMAESRRMVRRVTVRMAPHNERGKIIRVKPHRTEVFFCR